MKRIIILGPGKSGTTFLKSSLPNSQVLHDVARSRFLLITSRKKLFFFTKLILFKTLIILPHRPDEARKKSVFWNDLEMALLHFKNSGPDYKVLRYQSPEVFIRACYEHYPYETYASWFKRNNLSLITKIPKADICKNTFFRSKIVSCPLEKISDLISELDHEVEVCTDDPDFNEKGEFWHHILHEYLDGEGFECK